MRVLWITNILFPEAERLLIGKGELKSSGGWMLGAAEALLKYHSVDLYIATVTKSINEFKVIQGENVTYYILPYGNGNLSYNSEYELYWKKVQKIVQPDIVHIHGTEFTHGLAYIKSCGSSNVVVSIQGLKSVIADYYYSGITLTDVFRNITFRDLLRGSIIAQQKAFRNYSRYEVEIIRNVNNIIGRTSWDKAHVLAVNPHVHYHLCNETLRKEFYDGSEWDYATCTKYSIFLSQASNPIKGFHQVLKAMPLILRDYPDTTIRIAGNNLTAFKTLKDKIRLSGYGKFIRNLIQEYGIENRITYVGNLNATEMKLEYLRANVFICPSSIENSPNSLGEAQILGTPCVASYVGGIPDMMIGNEENLYRFEDIEMLAYKVNSVFASGECQKNMTGIASIRHDPQINSDKLYKIYQSIV